MDTVALFWVSLTLGFVLGIGASAMANVMMALLHAYVAAPRLRRTITVAHNVSERTLAGEQSYQLTVRITRRGFIAFLFPDARIALSASVTVVPMDEVHAQGIASYPGYWLEGAEPTPVASLGFGVIKRLQLATETGFASEAAGMRQGTFDVKVSFLDADTEAVYATWHGVVVVRLDKNGQRYALTVSEGVPHATP